MVLVQPGCIMVVISGTAIVPVIARIGTAICWMCCPIMALPPELSLMNYVRFWVSQVSLVWMGAGVTDMFDAGQVKEIRDYCETDVVNTWLVYLRHMHHRGTLRTEDYNRAVEETIACLKAGHE